MLKDFHSQFQNPEATLIDAVTVPNLKTSGRSTQPVVKTTPSVTTWNYQYEQYKFIQKEKADHDKYMLKVLFFFFFSLGMCDETNQQLTNYEKRETVH